MGLDEIDKGNVLSQEEMIKLWEGEKKEGAGMLVAKKKTSRPLFLVVTEVGDMICQKGFLRNRQ